MRKQLIYAVAMLLIAGCSNETETESVEQAKEYAEVRVHVDDFSVSVDDFPGGKTTRTETDVSEATDIKVVTIAFYDGSGTEVYKAEQNRSTYSGTFGEFSCDLPVGSYTMVAIGRAYFDGDEFTLTSPTEAAYTSERARETFCHTQSVVITTGSAVNVSVTLERVCSKLFLASTDNKVAASAKTRITYSGGGMGFNPTTGLATSNTGFVTEFSGGGYVGNPLGLNCYLFLGSDVQSMNVTIEVLDANNVVLFSKQVNDVPFKRNRVTKLQGALYTASPAAVAFKVQTDWETETVINF